MDLDQSFKIKNGKMITLREMDIIKTKRKEIYSWLELEPTTTCFICEKELYCLCEDPQSCKFGVGHELKKECNPRIDGYPLASLLGWHVKNLANHYISNHRLFHCCPNPGCGQKACKEIQKDY